MVALREIIRMALGALWLTGKAAPYLGFMIFDRCG